MTPEIEFSQLIEQHKRIIFKVIRLYVTHREDELDLFQEIIFQAWRSFPNFRGESKFSTWLYRISLNTVLTFIRRPRLVVPYEDLSVLKTSTGEKIHHEETEALYLAIRQLNEIDRMIVTLHLDGYANAEIADITGLKISNVAVKLHRIKEALIKKLKAQ